jgi:hypothetical protein
MLRVSAVKELPALSRMRDVGLLDCEGASDDARVADRPGSGCSPVVEVKRVVITGDPIQIKVPGVCLGGCIMHVKSRRVYERRLRPQTGCLVQRLSCYSGECRHGDSAAPRRRTMHRRAQSETTDRSAQNHQHSRCFCLGRCSAAPGTGRAVCGSASGLCGSPSTSRFSSPVAG